jgi:hypothetical protein
MEIRFHGPYEYHAVWLVENGDVVHPGQVQEQFCPFPLGTDRASLPFIAPDRPVTVQTHDDDISFFPGFFKQGHMPPVQDIKTPVGSGDYPLLPFKPLGQLTGLSQRQYPAVIIHGAVLYSIGFAYPEAGAGLLVGRCGGAQIL